MQLTKPERYAIGRQWGLWRRWLAHEKIVRGAGFTPPDRALLHRLLAAIREEMRDDPRV